MSSETNQDPESLQTTSKTTILQVVPSLVAGGVERGTIDIASALSEAGYRSLVLSSGGPLVQQLVSKHCEHIKLDTATKNPIFIHRNKSAIVQLIEKEKVNIIHARSRAPAWSCYFAAKETNTRFLTTFHGIYNFSNAFKKKYNSIMATGERVIAVSDFVRRHILENYEINEANIRLIYRGVDHRYFDPTRVDDEILAKFKEKYHIPKDTAIILLPARMSGWKGQTILIEALKLLNRKDFYCIIAGDLTKHPNLTHRIQSMIAEYKLQSKVQLFGPEMDMIGLYAIADIVLSTSIEPEAFGRVVIEAQAMEKIVIATNIGGAAETIKDEITGYHIPPANPEALAEKLNYAIDNLNSATMIELCKNARKSAISNFSLDLMKEKTLAVYKELL